MNDKQQHKYAADIRYGWVEWHCLEYGCSKVGKVCGGELAVEIMSCFPCVQFHQARFGYIKLESFEEIMKR
jgi:hypothetical protein